MDPPMAADSSYCLDEIADRLAIEQLPGEF
jgi:hypothetical protein